MTTPQLAYLRLHGRDAKAYITGKTVALDSITITATRKSTK